GGRVVKLALLTLGFVCAAPARADVSAQLPPTWRDQCAERLEQAATAAGLPGQARRDVVPLLREDGSPNPMQVVEFGRGNLSASVGNETERYKDKQWTNTTHAHGKSFIQWFRRAHGMFAKLTLADPALTQPFKAALDDCLQMGESK
ncbi:MAG TPA: hypothetical protein VGL86_03780, partial [Polyangia bacterium]